MKKPKVEKSPSFQELFSVMDEFMDSVSYDVENDWRGIPELDFDPDDDPDAVYKPESTKVDKG